MDLNPNFDMSVITMARGKKYLEAILNLKDAKYPLIVVLDKDFNILGNFKERPEIVKNAASFDDIKLDYYKGKYFKKKRFLLWKKNIMLTVLIWIIQK